MLIFLKRPVSKLFKPIFDGIFVESPNERLKLEETLTLLRGESLEKFVFDNVEPEQMTTIKLFSDTMPAKLNILLTSRNVEINKELSLRMNTLQMSPVSELEAKQYLVDRMSSRLEKRTIERIFNEAVKLLKKYQILTEFSLNAMMFVRIHRLVVESVKKSSRKRDEAKHRATRTRIIETLLAELKDCDTVSPKNVRKVKLTKNHIAQLLDESTQMERTIHELFNMMIAIEEKYYQNTSACVKYSEQFLKSFQSTFGSSQESPLSVLIKNQLAYAYIKDGSVEKAIQLQKETLTIVNRLLHDEPNDWLRARSLNNLAHMYYFAGDYAEALRLYRQAYEMSILYYKDKPNATPARELISIAFIHVCLGDMPEAIRVYEEALQMCQEKQDDQNMALILNSLAMSYSKVDKFMQAIETQEKCVEIRRRIYRDQSDHTDIAGALCDLAFFHTKIGENDRARELLTNALEMRRRFFAHHGDHLDIVKNLNRLGTFYRQINNHAEAIDAHREALEICRRISLEQQPSHRMLAETLYDLASSYLAADKFAEALELFQECLELRREIFSQQPDHPDVALCVKRLGDVHKGMGNYERAIEFYLPALEMRRRYYRNQSYHLTISESVYSLVRVYLARGNLPEALEFFRQSSEMFKHFLENDPYNLELAKDMTLLADELLKLADYSTAISLFEDALKIYRKNAEGKQLDARFLPDVVDTLKGLGFACLKIEIYSEAVNYFRECVETQRLIHQEKPDLMKMVRLLNILASSFRCDKNYTEAIRCYEEALDMWQQAGQVDGPFVVHLLNHLGLSYEGAGRFDDASTAYKRASSIANAIFHDDPDNKLVKECSQNLMRIRVRISGSLLKFGRHSNEK